MLSTLLGPDEETWREPGKNIGARYEIVSIPWKERKRKAETSIDPNLGNTPHEYVISLGPPLTPALRMIGRIQRIQALEDFWQHPSQDKYRHDTTLAEDAKQVVSRNLSSRCDEINRDIMFTSVSASVAHVLGEPPLNLLAHGGGDIIKENERQLNSEKQSGTSPGSGSVDYDDFWERVQQHLATVRERERQRHGGVTKQLLRAAGNFFDLRAFRREPSTWENSLDRWRTVFDIRGEMRDD